MLTIQGVTQDALVRKIAHAAQTVHGSAKKLANAVVKACPGVAEADRAALESIVADIARRYYGRT